MRFILSAVCSEKENGQVRRVLADAFHLWWGLYATFDFYLPYLCHHSHFTSQSSLLWTVTSSEVIYAFKSIVLDPITITSAYSMRVCESALSTEAAVWWFSIDLLNCQGYSVFGKWLCLSLLCPSPKLKIVTVGISARDLGSRGYLCLCVNDIAEQNIVHCTSLCSRFSLQNNCWAPLRVVKHPVCSWPSDPNTVLRWMLIQ